MKGYNCLEKTEYHSRFCSGCQERPRVPESADTLPAAGNLPSRSGQPERTPRRTVKAIPPLLPQSRPRMIQARRAFVSAPPGLKILPHGAPCSHGAQPPDPPVSPADGPEPFFFPTAGLRLSRPLPSIPVRFFEGTFRDRLHPPACRRTAARPTLSTLLTPGNSPGEGLSHVRQFPPPRANTRPEPLPSSGKAAHRIPGPLPALPPKDGKSPVLKQRRALSVHLRRADGKKTGPPLLTGRRRALPDAPAKNYSLFCEMTCLARVASGALGNLRTSSFRRCLAAAFLLSWRNAMPCFR